MKKQIIRILTLLICSSVMVSSCILPRERRREEGRETHDRDQHDEHDHEYRSH